MSISLNRNILLAGDYVKFGFPMASATTVLLWGLIEFRDAYSRAGELDNMLNSVRWPLDYFLKAKTGTNEFYAQVSLLEARFYSAPLLQDAFLHGTLYDDQSLSVYIEVLSVSHHHPASNPTRGVWDSCQLLGVRLWFSPGTSATSTSYNWLVTN